MKHIYENRIPTEDNLRKSLIDCRYILNDKAYEYLNTLLDMKINPLADNLEGNNTYVDLSIIKIKKALEELQLYRDIVALNMYNRSKTYAGNDHFVMDNAFKTGVNICYNVSEHKTNLLYTFNYDFDNNCTINVYSQNVKSVLERATLIKNEADDILKTINKSSRLYGNRYLKSKEYSILKARLDYIENLTITQLRDEHNRDFITSNEGKCVLDNLLDDLNMDINDDFANVNGNQVYQKQLVKIIVNR